MNDPITAALQAVILASESSVTGSNWDVQRELLKAFDALVVARHLTEMRDRERLEIRAK